MLVLGDVVFPKIEVRRLRDGTGWLALPIEAGRNPSEYLRNAGKVFGAEQQWLLDLRWSDEERAKPAKAQGQFTAADVSEIKRVVFMMASRQILESLAEYTYDAWPRELRKWPGRQALDITGGGPGAAVYCAPDAGYQLEKIDGKWTIVGG